MRALVPVKGLVKTAIHFQKDDDPERVPRLNVMGNEDALTQVPFWLPDGKNR